MTRRDHRGRYTNGTTPATRQHGAPLLKIARKSPAHVKGERTKRERHWARVMAVKAVLDRELGRWATADDDETLKTVALDLNRLMEKWQ